MKHRYFPKINEGVTASSLPGIPWVATEKIHGAQFVIGTDGKSIRFGKRKAWLEEGEPFFGWQLLRGALSACAFEVFTRVREAAVVFLYGELFGGGYPHPAVAQHAAITPVQTGIWYSPDIQYAVFDVLKARSEDDLGTFFAFNEVERLVTGTGIQTVPKITVGTYESAQALPVRFESLVPARFNLPVISRNYAEGLVLKPDINLPAGQRPIVKLKIPEFQENQFDESQAFNPNVFASLDELSALCDRMVNPVRVASARSKAGERRRAVVEEGVLDVLIDLEAVFPLRMRGLSEKDEALLKNHIEQKFETLMG